MLKPRKYRRASNSHQTAQFPTVCIILTRAQIIMYLLVVVLRPGMVKSSSPQESSLMSLSDVRKPCPKMSFCKSYSVLLAFWRVSLSFWLVLCMLSASASSCNYLLQHTPPGARVLVCRTHVLLDWTPFLATVIYINLLIILKIDDTEILLRFKTREGY